ncbi:hypothetical protein [Mycobacterium kyogaense]|uniref:hypothetical protein n=1 Tax=Mycobacterium kyogaense TaxID=2212479 RepID=UPI000DADDE4D|nr:hypothetical protein [Mycobacterium kyogaense]
MWLSDDQKRITEYLALEVILNRQRRGQPIPQAIRDLISAIAASGTPDCAEPAHSDRDDDDWIGSRPAARILRCTPRRVRDIANDLGGRKTGRDWLFHRPTVIDYARSKNG